MSVIIKPLPIFISCYHSSKLDDAKELIMKRLRGKFPELKSWDVKLSTDYGGRSITAQEFYDNSPRELWASFVPPEVSGEESVSLNPIFDKNFPNKAAPAGPPKNGCEYRYRVGIMYRSKRDFGDPEADSAFADV